MNIVLYIVIYIVFKVYLHVGVKHVYILYLYRYRMARTKQTARKSSVKAERQKILEAKRGFILF